MSVKIFSIQEIMKIRNQIFSILITNEHFKLKVKQTALFKNKFYNDFNSDIKSDELLSINKLINKLFWYLYISNRVAYSLHYKEPISLDFEGYKPISRINEIYPSIGYVRDYLRLLQYNIFTEDGNYFLSKEWEELFETVLDFFENAQD